MTSFRQFPIRILSRYADIIPRFSRIYHIRGHACLESYTLSLWHFPGDLALGVRL